MVQGVLGAVGAAVGDGDDFEAEVLLAQAGQQAGDGGSEGWAGVVEGDDDGEFDAGVGGAPESGGVEDLAGVSVCGLLPAYGNHGGDGGDGYGGGGV